MHIQCMIPSVLLCALLILGTGTADAAPLSSTTLGPVRACRCYTRAPFPASLSAYHRAITSTSESLSISHSPAEICHCAPTIAASGANEEALETSGRSLINSHKDKCWHGPNLELKFTLAEVGTMSLCGTEVASGSRNEITKLTLDRGTYPCGDFVFKLVNPTSDPQYLGVAFSFTLGGVATLVASTPRRWGLARRTLSVTAKAAVSQSGDCTDPAPVHGAQVVQNLVVTGLFDGSNAKFEEMESEQAWPLGVTSFTSKPGEVQCVIINNPFCLENSPYP